jgi:hypothetical protein
MNRTTPRGESLVASSKPDRERSIIWTETLVLMAVYIVAIWLTNRFLQPRIASPWLALALGFCAVQCVVVFSLLGWLMARKQWFLWLRARAEQLSPEIQGQLAIVALGAPMLPDSIASANHGADEGEHEFRMGVRTIRDRLSLAKVETSEIEPLQDLQKRYPREFESCFVRFMPSVSGVGRDRLSRVAEHLGLVKKWEIQYRSGSLETRRQAVQHLAQLSTGTATQALLKALNDPDILIRIEAARGLIRGGGQSERERLFLFLTTQPLIVQSMLVVDLMPYAEELNTRAIPDALNSPDPQLVRVTLQILEAWGRGLTIENYHVLLGHTNAEVRAQAFRAFAFANGEGEVWKNKAQWVAAGLGDEDDTVRAAAAVAAGRLNLSTLVPHLEEVLRDSHTNVSTSAAFALAQLEPEGPAALEKAVVEAPPDAAAAALEALEKLHMGRLDFAQL